MAGLGVAIEVYHQRAKSMLLLSVPLVALRELSGVKIDGEGSQRGQDIEDQWKEVEVGAWLEMQGKLGECGRKDGGKGGQERGVESKVEGTQDFHGRQDEG